MASSTPCSSDASTIRLRPAHRDLEKRGARANNAGDQEDFALQVVLGCADQTRSWRAALPLRQVSARIPSPSPATLPGRVWPRSMRSSAHAPAGACCPATCLRNSLSRVYGHVVRDLRVSRSTPASRCAGPAASSVAHRATDRTTAGGESGMLHRPPLRWRPGRRRRHRRMRCTACAPAFPRDHATNGFAHQIADDAELVQARPTR